MHPALQSISLIDYQTLRSASEAVEIHSTPETHSQTINESYLSLAMPSPCHSLTKRSGVGTAIEFFHEIDGSPRTTQRAEHASADTGMVNLAMKKSPPGKAYGPFEAGRVNSGKYRSPPGKMYGPFEAGPVNSGKSYR